MCGKYAFCCSAGLVSTGAVEITQIFSANDTGTVAGAARYFATISGRKLEKDIPMVVDE
jgi:hypothetical protein